MKQHVVRLLVIAGCLGAFALPLAGAGAVASAGKAEDVGLSTERLGRIRDAVKRHIDAGSLPGAVTIVARRGKIAHFEAHGLIDVDAKRPMPRDAVFRLASMSKPITAVAVMMMIEEGKVRLSDPVSRFIPEFAGAKVAMPRPGRAGGGGAPGGPGAPGGRGAAPQADLVTASRDITVRDLLTHTSGLMSGGAGNAFAPQRSPTDTLETYIAKLGAVPLDYQPGTMWRYSGLAGFDVLSRIVEVASGQTFDRFLRQRLFDPLGMKDTGFSLPSDRSRLVPLYRRVEKGFELQPNQDGLSSAVYFSGAGGMVSTAEDYLQFAQMLVNGGELNGRRYLSPRTIDLMASNHTGEMVNGQFGRPARGMGFGLGVQVVEDPVAADLRQSKGTFGWAGAYGTNQNMDRHEKMVTVIMMQVSTGALQRDFDNAVMQSIID
jgi:CubicO group peptidase (beta-lactamase class C family)